MRTIYVGGEHEVRCDGKWHWRYYSDAPAKCIGPCGCPRGPYTATFTTQHYEAIAKAIAPLAARSCYHDVGIEFEDLVECLATLFAADNPEFRREEFGAACNTYDPQEEYLRAMQRKEVL